MSREEKLAKLAELDALIAEQQRRHPPDPGPAPGTDKEEREGNIHFDPPDPMSIPAVSDSVRPDAPPIGYGVPAAAFAGKFSGANPNVNKQPRQAAPGIPRNYPPGQNGYLSDAERSHIPPALGGMVGEVLGGPVGGGLGMAAGGAIGRSMRGQEPFDPIPTGWDALMGAGPGLAMKGAGAVGGAMAGSSRRGVAAFGNKLQAFARGLLPGENAMRRHPMQNQLELDPIVKSGPEGANQAVLDTAHDAAAKAPGYRLDPDLSDAYPYAARHAQEIGDMAPGVAHPGDLHGYAHVGNVGVRIPMPGARAANGFPGNAGATDRWLSALAEATRRGRQYQLIPELRQFAQQSMTPLGPESRGLTGLLAGLLGTEAP